MYICIFLYIHTEELGLLLRCFDFGGRGQVEDEAESRPQGDEREGRVKPRGTRVRWKSVWLDVASIN